MAEIISYTTASRRSTFRFLFMEEEDRWQAYVLEGPAFPAELVSPVELPPGCERHNGRIRIRWFQMARLDSAAKARSLAAYWAEEIEAFLAGGTWKLPYQSNDGRDRFEFSIERHGGGFRVYILRHPRFRGSAVGVHILPEGRRKYVCWNQEIDHWNDAEDVATAWAEHLQEYIRTGRRF